MRRVLKWAGIIIGAFVLLIVVVSVATAGHQNGSNSSAPSTQASSNAPSSVASTANSAPSKASSTVTYVVTGSPADVTYGPAGSNYTGTAPMRVIKPLGHASFYSISAQLNGEGTVNVEILVNGKTVSKGRASGSYNIASAEIVQNPITGAWEDTNSN